MMDDSTEEIYLGDFCHTDLKIKLDNVKQILNNSKYEGSKESLVIELLQSCVEMLSTGKIALECMKNESCVSTIIVTHLISYEKGVIASFKHCSESNLIYGELINNVKQLLTDLFKRASEVQTLFFNILENVNFDFTLKEDLNLLLSSLNHVWHGAEAVFNASNKIMSTNWKMYINMSQKYSTELKKNMINDEPINFLCAEIKKIVSSFHYNDEVALKLSTYLMSVLVKLCSYGRVLKSHNTLVEFILFLNSYWLSDTQDTIAVKGRLLQFVDQLVLVTDETFVMIFQSICQDIINSNSLSQKMSALYIAALLLKRLTKDPCENQASIIICIVFLLMTDSVMCCYNIDIYENLLINSAALILLSDYNLFIKVEKMLIQNILSTQYWPAMFSSDLWIILMRYSPPDLCSMQFSKLTRLLEVLIVLPCYVQSPQHIYLETLLRRHFILIRDKTRLKITCPQLEIQSVKSAIGILHVPTLSKYDRLSELVKILTVLPEQNNFYHLNEDLKHIWSCIKDEYPPSFLCSLVEVTISSKTLLKSIIPQTVKILSCHSVNDTTDMKRCRLLLIRSILLQMPTFQESLIMEIFLEYLFDNHPMIRQWTVETIVYFSSVTGIKNNLITMLFKTPKVASIITDYLEMKINGTFSFNDFEQYFNKLSLHGQFHHKCSFKNKLDKILDKLKTDIDCLHNIVTKIQTSADELERLKESSYLLNDICKAAESKISY